LAVGQNGYHALNKEVFQASIENTQESRWPPAPGGDGDIIEKAGDRSSDCDS
jgi:hypothetical protein